MESQILENLMTFPTNHSLLPRMLSEHVPCTRPPNAWKEWKLFKIQEGEEDTNGIQIWPYPQPPHFSGS